MERTVVFALQKRYRAPTKRNAELKSELKKPKKARQPNGCELVSGKLNYAIIMRG